MTDDPQPRGAAAANPWAVPLAAPGGPRGATVFRPGVLAGLFIAFWAGQFAIWLPGYVYAGIFTDPLATAGFDVLSWMAVGTLSMAVGFVLPFRNETSVRQFVAIVAGAAMLVALRLYIVELFAPRFGWTVGDWPGRLMTFMPRHLLITTSYVGLGYGMRSAMRSEREQARLAELDSLLANTRLMALRTHLRPRLLLRSMQSIADGITADPRRADARVIGLSDLLRLQLGRARRRRVSVHEELEFIRRYTELDQSCTGAEVSLDVRVEDGAGTVMIPPNSISILVESALRARPPAVGAIHIRLEAAVHPDELHVVVNDDCPVPIGERGLEGWAEAIELSESLVSEFGPRFAPEFRDQPPGAVARLRLPIQSPSTKADDRA